MTHPRSRCRAAASWLGPSLLIFLLAGTIDLSFTARECRVDLDADGLHLFHF
ncbi:MAG: hypothetical protein QGH45_09525 [Myxococcota bacterium]|jgi:hypothetical protein|nr:hypothetical protein [Myxococcota bacterium]